MRRTSPISPVNLRALYFRSAQAFVLPAAAFSLAAITTATAATTTAATTAKARILEPTSADLVALESGPFHDALVSFYRSREFKAVWLEGDGFTNDSRTLQQRLQSAADEGLDPGDYEPSPSCNPFLSTARPDDECEWQLSHKLLQYASDVGFGVFQASQTDPNWHIPQESLAAVDLLQRVADAGDIRTVLDTLPPSTEQYRRMREALQRYNDSTLAPDGVALPDQITLQPGQRHSAIRTLRQYFSAKNPEITAVNETAFFGALLENAVRSFQAQHGLVADGIVGARTRAQLRVSRNDRLGQIRLNMERLRWLPRTVPSHRVEVNLAAFEAAYKPQDGAPLRSRVIVGRADRSSPSFHTYIPSIKLNPEWTVPRSLAIFDLLPQLQENRAVLQQKSLEVLQPVGTDLHRVDADLLDWSNYDEDYFPFILRQKPGATNSLGRVKFNMPNPYGIFLHDTPEKWLFDHSVRTFSSGCVRVERALELARALLSNGSSEEPPKILDRLENGEPHTLTLPAPIPVFLLYFTAWVDDFGNLQFRDDVYGRNVSLRDYFSML